MAGERFSETPKDQPAQQGGEILLAQLTGAPKGRGSLADEILNGKPTGAEPPPPGDATPPKPKDVPAAPKDVPAAPAKVADGTDVVLKLSYNDPKFDEAIWKTVKYNTLEITDFPKDARLQHWQDKNGDFFWLTDKSGKPIDNKFHYYPGNVAKLTVNGNTQDLNVERRKVREAIAKRDGIDVLDGVMTLSYKDANFDKKIFQTNLYDTLNMKDLPPGGKLTHAMDDKGFFFEVGDGKKHYYPNNAKQLSVDGKIASDLTKTRYEVIEKYADANAGGFKSFERQRNPLANSDQVKNFADGMSRQSAKSLDVLDRNLTEAVKSSEHHPYFKYLLANVKLAQAMGAIRERVLTGQEINHPSVVEKIDKCDELLDQVMKESDGRLRKMNRFPKFNAPLMPLSPYSAYDPRNPNGLYEFWGGTYDQAAFMKPGVKLIRGLVEANALQLPPVRP
ncbi:MAG: hypothetical protein SGJ27_11785 [Candidatus Melainabacteria bacterium]|nr:hypothetical protein [Candidatus Melainabacteria bacterium]